MFKSNDFYGIQEIGFLNKLSVGLTAFGVSNAQTIKKKEFTCFKRHYFYGLKWVLMIVMAINFFFVGFTSKHQVEKTIIFVEYEDLSLLTVKNRTDFLE